MNAMYKKLIDIHFSDFFTITELLGKSLKYNFPKVSLKMTCTRSNTNSLEGLKGVRELYFYNNLLIQNTKFLVALGGVIGVTCDHLLINMLMD